MIAASGRIAAGIVLVLAALWTPEVHAASRSASLRSGREVGRAVGDLCQPASGTLVLLDAYSPTPAFVDLSAFQESVASVLPQGSAVKADGKASARLDDADFRSALLSAYGSIVRLELLAGAGETLDVSISGWCASAPDDKLPMVAWTVATDGTVASDAAPSTPTKKEAPDTRRRSEPAARSDNPAASPPPSPSSVAAAPHRMGWHAGLYQPSVTSAYTPTKGWLKRGIRPTLGVTIPGAFAELPVDLRFGLRFSTGAPTPDDLTVLLVSIAHEGNADVPFQGWSLHERFALQTLLVKNIGTPRSAPGGFALQVGGGLDLASATFYQALYDESLGGVADHPVRLSEEDTRLVAAGLASVGAEIWNGAGLGLRLVGQGQGRFLPTPQWDPGLASDNGTAMELGLVTRLELTGTLGGGQ